MSSLGLFAIATLLEAKVHPCYLCDCRQQPGRKTEAGSDEPAGEYVRTQMRLKYKHWTKFFSVANTRKANFLHRLAIWTILKACWSYAEKGTSQALPYHSLPSLQVGPWRNAAYSADFLTGIIAIKYTNNISHNKLPGMMEVTLSLCVTPESDQHLPHPWERGQRRSALLPAR